MTTPLDPADRDRFAEMLRLRREALHRCIDNRLAGGSRAEHAREMLLQDGDDAPQRSSDRQVDLVLTDLETVQLNALDAALQRLADGRYGRCEQCGAEIPAPRLAAEPEAALCLDCQRALERGRVRNASL